MDINKAITEQKEIEKEGEFAFVEGEFKCAIAQAAGANFSVLDSLELRNLILSFAPHEAARADIQFSYAKMVGDGRSENEMCTAAIGVLHDGVFENNWPWAPLF